MHSGFHRNGGTADEGSGEVLAKVVDRLLEAEHGPAEQDLRNTYYHLVPSRTALAEVVELLRSAFFPGFFGRTEVSDASLKFHIGATISQVQRILQEQVQKGLSFTCDADPHGCVTCAKQAKAITGRFLERLPEVRCLLESDVRAAYEGDPAASCTDEVLICYPGLLAMTNHRLAHELYRLEVPMLPRVIAEHAHSISGIDIHPGAVIGERFFIDHGTGVVIGQTCQIGNRVRLYQGVTLGSKSFPLDEAGNPIKGIARHPVVEDDVTIYAGATVLGRITLGKGSIIGGNVWVTESCPPGSRITQARACQELFSQGAGI